MIDAKSRRSASGGRRDSLLSGKAAAQDNEAHVAAALRPADRYDSAGSARAHIRPVPAPLADRPDAKARRVADEIAGSVEARLPGRIRDLKVRADKDQFVLSGVSSSYYVKQVAQHVAMSALNALMLGRLVNEIQVHSMR
jgi:hypothetical protein